MAKKPLDRGAPNRSGAPNHKTRVMKEALLLAAEAVGADGKGKDALVGYLTKVAKEDYAVFCSMLGRLIPLQHDATVEVKHSFTREEAVEHLRERGIMLGQSLFAPPRQVIEHDANETPRRERLNGNGSEH